MSIPLSDLVEDREIAMLKYLGPTLPSLLAVIVCCARAADDTAPLTDDMQTLRNTRLELRQDARPNMETVIARGIVEAIDPGNRMFALTESTGKTTTIYAGANMQAFAQLQLGERATVRYSKAVALAIARNGVLGQAAVSDQPAVDPLSKPLMDIPAEQLQAQSNMLGKVAAIDLRNRHVVIEDRDGLTVEMRVPSDEMLAKLKIGERVLVTYAEATALSARPE